MYVCTYVWPCSQKRACLSLRESPSGQDRSYHPLASTHVQYTRTDSVRIFDLRSVRTVKAVTNREHLSYGPHVSFSSPGLHLIKDGAPWALTVRTFRSVRQACI